MKTQNYFGADQYNCAAYGQYAFGECNAQGAGGGLSYTGEIMMVPIALASAIIVASAILLVKKLRRGKLENKAQNN